MAGITQKKERSPKGAPFGAVEGTRPTTTEAVDNLTVRLDFGTKDGVKSIRIGFTDQRRVDIFRV